MAYTSGESALVIPVPGADRAVGEWRDEHDPSARAGMPAHITLLYPFVPADRLTRTDTDALRLLFAEHAKVDFQLQAFGRFPGVLYLAPDRARPFVELTERIVACWPDCPPFGGAFAEIIPHLTVAVDASETTEGEIERDLRPRMPLIARASEVALCVFDGDVWERAATFRLGGA